MGSSENTISGLEDMSDKLEHSDNNEEKNFKN
jgi:hypothetical protein